jgi:hypothetical protein
VHFAVKGVYSVSTYPQSDLTSHFNWNLAAANTSGAGLDSVTHTFPASGGGEVLVTATDTLGCPAQQAVSFRMRVSGNPIASLNPQPLCEGQTFTPTVGTALNSTVVIDPVEYTQPASLSVHDTIFLPDGAKATKITLYSVTGTNSSSRTSYWKEVAGQAYTPETTTVLDLNADRSAPNAVSFTLPNVEKQLTFTNTGEQQCIIIYLEYHYGGDTLMGDVNSDQKVDVEDVVGIVNQILGEPAANFNPATADLNGDGKIDVDDVVAVVNIILEANSSNARKQE